MNFVPFRHIHYLRRFTALLLASTLLISVGHIWTGKAVFAALQPASAASATFYVSPSGSDTAPGTITQPWKTIQKAANTLKPGQTVLIRAGVYHERVQPAQSGASGQEITYAAYPDEKAVIDGSGITLPNTLAGLFQIDGKNYINLQGLEVTHAGPYSESAAILVQYSSYITLEHVHTNHSTSSGILTWDSNHITVEGSTVEDANQTGIHECLSIGLTHDFEVSNNLVFTCQREGIDLKDGSYNGVVKNNIVHDVAKTGIYVDAWNKDTHDITLNGNLVHDSANHGIELSSEQNGRLSNINVYNNIVYHNRYVGLMISNQSLAPIDNLRIANNTLVNNGWVDWGGGLWVDNPHVTNLRICNNILSQSIYFQMEVTPGVPAAGVTIDHNLVDGYRGQVSEGETYGANHLTGNPRFQWAAGGNYHIRGDSPAIHAGLPSCAPTDDFDGQTRPANAIDLGADQFFNYSNKVFLSAIFR